MSEKAVKNTRVRNDFTATEEQDLVEFLADYELRARATIFPYRELTEKPRGSKHSAQSWLSRYKRFRSIYNVRIEGFILENSLRANHRADEDRESILEPARKKPDFTLRRACSASTPDIDETFGNIPISFARFMKNPSQLSPCDQWIGLNLAINFLGETYGVDPEVVYATWERSRSLTNTAAHLRDCADNDDETESLQIQGSRGREDYEVTSRPIPGPSKRKRSSSHTSSADDELPIVPTPPANRVHGAKRYSDVDIVPTSEPGERDVYSLTPQQITPALKHRRHNTAVHATPQPSPISDHSPRVADTHPSDADDSESEESDSSLEESTSDSEAHPPQLRPKSSTHTLLLDQRLSASKEADSDPGSEASLPDQKQVRVRNAPLDSASEASSQHSQSRRTLFVQRPAEDEEDESGSENGSEPSSAHASLVAASFAADESESGSEAFVREPRSQLTVTDKQLNDEPHARLQAEEASQSENESDESSSQRSSSDRSNVPKPQNNSYEESYIPTQVSLFG
ncbi:hypothetical protein B0H12DRAFT_1121599 [Mycena haematopus]|nr:hypothetical protein B0H12DRAFT_1121599 [Mycena haematopus]